MPLFILRKIGEPGLYFHKLENGPEFLGGQVEPKVVRGTELNHARTFVLYNGLLQRPADISEKVWAMLMNQFIPVPVKLVVLE